MRMTMCSEKKVSFGELVFTLSRISFTQVVFIGVGTLEERKMESTLLFSKKVELRFWQEIVLHMLFTMEFVGPNPDERRILVKVEVFGVPKIY